ncbi:putative Mg(2+) transport ATPase [compost metagenome]
MSEELLLDVFYLLLSAVLSGLIGLEREWRNKAAGFRTHVLVGMGTTLLTILSTQGFVGGDPSRIAAQVVTGIGFIGAGVILHRGYLVRGLTTASTLWMTMAIGMSVGVGWLALATIATTFALGSLLLLGYIADLLPFPERQRIYLDVFAPPEQAPQIRTVLEAARGVVRRGERTMGVTGPEFHFSVVMSGVTGGEILAWVDRLTEAGAFRVTWNSIGEEPI